MGKWKYHWHIQFYNGNLFLEDYWTDAKDRAEAIDNLRKSGKRVIEILSCRRTDTW